MSGDEMSWRGAIARQMLAMKDATPIVAVAPDEASLDVEFDGGYGGANGPAFLVWTETHVYFPLEYDGAEYVGSAPRNPRPEGQEHQ